MSETMRLLVGYDASAVSDVVLGDLKNAGLPDRVEAVVLTAADMPFPGYLQMGLKGQTELVEQIGAARKDAMVNAVKQAADAAKRLRAMFPNWIVSSEASSESPAWALLKKAEDWKASLIVVGAHGHSQLKRFMGSVSQLVLMNAPCSVRIARKPAGKVDDGDFRILIGADGSRGAEKAVDTVHSRHWPEGARIHVLSTLHSQGSVTLVPVPAGIRTPHLVTSQERHAVNQMVESIAHGLRIAGRNAEGYVREGDPKRVIVTEAEGWHANCIFMGARGLSSMRRFLLGSVSMAVAARAHCSVEVVK